MKYDVDYFIAKFSAIPDDLWTTNQFADINNPARRCASGHTRDIAVEKDHSGTMCFDYCRSTPETRALNALFDQHDLCVTMVNDGDFACFPQNTPKARVLAALKYIKSNA